MPELPEVTVIVNGLNKKLKGLVLESVEYDWPKKFYWGEFSADDLKGAEVLGVRRLGKVVIVDLESRNSGPAARHPRPTSSPALHALMSEKSLSAFAREELTAGARRGAPTRVTRLSILIHLKLTGQLIYQDAETRIAGGHPIPPLNLPVPNKTTRVTFTFSNHGKLFFNDIRKFGWVKVVESEESKVKSAIGMALGPDPLVMSYEEFRERIGKRAQSRIKKLLMDQSFIAGVGNIYSDEALWRSKIHPKRSAISLQPLEVRRLFDGIRESLKLAIDKGGSSANAFVDSGGEKGLYLSFAKAYHMAGKPCARCKTPIVREKMDGRSAHFCPHCQKLKINEIAF